MKIKKIAQDYYQAYLDRDLDIVKSLLDPNFEALSEMMKFHTAQEYLDGSWNNTDSLVGLDYELEVVDEENNSAFFVLKWDFGNSTIHTAEYLETQKGKITKIIWINMGPEFFKKILKE